MKVSKWLLYFLFIHFFYYQPFIFLHFYDEHYYYRIHLVFLEQNPKIASFDMYRPSWEFLIKIPKFASISRALQPTPSERERRKLFSPDEKSSSLKPDESKVDTSGLETPFTTPHALWAKKQLREDKRRKKY
jgi:hypothetical protein